MDLKIIKKQENPLLFRRKIEAKATFFKETTPKKEDIKKKIASMEKADENLVVVRDVIGSFGVGEANVLAYIYKSEEWLKKIEPKKKEKKKAAKPTGEAAEEDKEKEPEKE